ERNGETIQADATCLARDYFVVLAHHTERYEHGNQCGERGELVGKIRHQKTEISHDDKKRNAVPRDVVQQFKKREGLEQENKRNHHQKEVRKKAPEEIKVHQAREAVALLIRG